MKGGAKIKGGMMDFKKIISDSMWKALKSGTITFSQFQKLQHITVKVSDRKIKSLCGRVSMSSNGTHIITLYSHASKKFSKDHFINGIMPTSEQHVMEIVLQHEVGHIITNMKGGTGHDKIFKEVTSTLFGHTDNYIRSVKDVEERKRKSRTKT